MKSVVKIALVLAFLLSPFLLSNSCFAQVYLGGSAGSSSPSVNEDDQIPELDNDIGFRVYVGNQLSEKFSVELAYVDLGSYDVGTLDGMPDANELEDTLSPSGAEFSFVGKWPVFKHFSVFGRIGLFVWEAERSIVLNSVADGESPTIDVLNDGRDYSVGFGFDYQFMRNVGFTLEINQYKTDSVANNFAGAGFYFTF